MRYLALVASIALAPGCIITSDDSTAFCGDGKVDPGEACDDGNSRDGDGCSASCNLEVTPHATTATWSFQTTAGVAQSCPSGFDTAIVVSWKVDGSGNPIGTCTPADASSESCYVDKFPCAAKTGTTGPIPDIAQFPDAASGNQQFLTYVAIANHDGTSVYATTLADVEDLTTADQVFPSDPAQEHGTIYTDGGRFAAHWLLVGASGALTCASAMSSRISLVTKSTAAPDGIVAIFNCDDTVGITTGIAAGDYTIQITALDGSSPAKPLGTVTSLAAQTIHGPAACTPTADCVTDLGTVTLNVAGH